MNRQIALLLLILLILILGMHAAAIHFNWYWTLPMLDIPMHFLGGVWVGIVAVFAFGNGKTKTGAFLATLAAVLAVGLLWEGYELLIGFTDLHNPLLLLDTMKDLIMDIVGSIGAFLLMYNRLKFRTTNG